MQKLYKGKWWYFGKRIRYTTRIFQTGFFRSNKRSLLLIKFNEKTARKDLQRQKGDNMQNEPKWQEPVEYISIGVVLGVIFTIFIYGGYLL